MRMEPRTAMPTYKDYARHKRPLGREVFVSWLKTLAIRNPDLSGSFERGR